MNFETIGDPKYLALRTFRKSGEGVVTPVWAVAKQGKIYVMTDLNSWKVKRIRANPKIEICISDWRGKPRSAWVEARAVLSDSKDLIEQTQEWIKSKYRLGYCILRLIKPRPKKDSHAVIIEISSE